MSSLPIIKRIVLSTVLAVESFFVGLVLKSFIQTQNYFSFSLEFTIKIVVLLIITLYTLAICVGTLEKWVESLLLAGGVSVGLAAVLITYDIYYATAVALGSFIFTAFNSYKSFRFNKNMVKTLPKHSLRFSARGILLIFGVTAAVIFLLESSGDRKLNIGQKVGELIEKPVQSIVQSQIPKEIPDVPLEGFNITSIFSPEAIDIKGMVETQINKFLEPYKRLFSPVVAVLIFAIFQFYATIAYFLYYSSINPLFSILKKIGMIKTEKVQVEKEQLTL